VKLLVYEPHADGLLDLALRAQEAGHAVRYWCGDRTATSPRPVGRGLVECVSDWRTSMRWADLVLLGSNGINMIEFDRWAAEGVPIIGAGAEAVKWELDRLAGMQAFKRAGIPVPPFRQCATLDEAIVYAAKRDEGMAAKPSGDVADKSLSFVAKTGKEMVWRLQRWKREGKRFPAGLILQDRVEGIEMAVGAWVGPAGFAPGWEENFEEKKLFAGGIGPNTGEAGTVMRLVKSSKLADKVMKPLEDRLVRLGYVGNVDVNCIIDEDGTPWPLEFTMRFGYPAINIEVALHGGDPINYLAGLAAGKPPNERRLDEIAVGVVMALPPYPFGHEKAEEVVGVPIWGVTPNAHDRLHFCNVMMGEAPEISGGAIGKEAQLCTAGSYILVATGTGQSVVEARNQTHRAIGRLTIPASPFWRNDIGLRLRSGIDELNRHGFAKGLRYS
jgi:phosphoribosylamine---glycine ligase